ncbi:MAG: hypothetical protein NXI01_08840 [Gammaproteobacteria bacterium]|nr:hypothetical protein [Gammaproteobacteria bacterium]
MIERLNGYLAWHHFPIEMDKEGMCRGLASVNVKYILEGKGHEFLEMLEKISGDIQPDSEHDNFINHFVVEVALTQMPYLFDAGVSEQGILQKNSIQCLEIEGERLSSSFDLSMSTKDENWVEIISNLELKEDEPILVSNNNHCISVKKTSSELGKYVVYNPNYPEGIRCFADETALVQELREILPPEDKESESLGLLISVIRHPSIKEQRIPSFPNAQNLYAKYLTHSREGGAVDNAQELDDNLIRAAAYGDSGCIEQLAALGAKDFNTATRKAIEKRNPNSFCALLPKFIEHHPEQVDGLLTAALWFGSEEIIDVFIDMRKSDYEALLSIEALNTKINLQTSIDALAYSGSYKILEKVLADAKQMAYEKTSPNKSEVVRQKESNDKVAMCVFGAQRYDIDPIERAIEEGSVDCIRVLMTFADSSICAFTEEQKVEYLLQAIRKNQTTCVRYLMNQVSPEAIQSLVMSVRAVDKTELSILRQLKHAGMPFDGDLDVAFKKKEGHAIGFGANAAIVFLKFTDYLIDMLRQDSGVNIYKGKLQSLKGDAITQTKDQLNIGPETSSRDTRLK